MLTKFWAGLGEGLAEKWIGYAISPALIFWATGVAAWVWKNKFKELEIFLTNTTVIEGAIYVIVGLLILIASSALMNSIASPILRFLEGYWPGWLFWLRSPMVKFQTNRLEKAEQQWNKLKVKEDELTEKERFELANLEQNLHYVPSDPKEYMPSKLGNILRSAETGPRDKYSLDAVVCWPRLWMLLPEEVRKDFADSRSSLDQFVMLGCWGVLSIIWTCLAWWALPIGLIIAWIAYRLALNAASVYADLVASAFDIYRTSLYKMLRWPLPANPEEEHTSGELVTEYLWRGSDGKLPVFEKSDEDEE